MAVYARVDGKQKKVSEVDTTLMLTLRDVIPNDIGYTKKYLVKKKDAPDGKLRSFYNTKDNSGLVRKIFTTCLKVILFEIAMGKCKFIAPSRGRGNPCIYMGEMNDKVVQFKRKTNRLKHFDMMGCGYKIPYIKYMFSQRSTRQHLEVYVNKSIYAEMVEHANSGARFSQRPRDIDYFLPYIYEEFSYIKEHNLEKLVKDCFRKLAWHLKRGEEVRCIDGDGEIRFFRPLGKIHDKVMRKVVKARLTRERNKKNESISKSISGT